MDTTDKAPILEVKHLVKCFGERKILKDIDFSINRGDVISVIGSSGSGKSTLLPLTILEGMNDIPLVL